MFKRSIAAVLWFGSTWFAMEVLISVTGLPRAFGPVIAAGVAGIVTVDPLRLFWPMIETPSRPAHTVQSIAVRG
jgi:hypothetical protein